MTAAALGRWLRGEGGRPNGVPVRASAAVTALASPEGPWSTVFDRVFGDHDSALEAILSLPVPDEPSVLRIEAQGADGFPILHERLSGDWLCDAEASPRPARLGGRASWSSSHGCAEWVGNTPWLDAWQWCPDGLWLLESADDADVDDLLLVRATLACARAAFDAGAQGDDRVLTDVELAFDRGLTGAALRRAIAEKRAMYSAYPSPHPDADALTGAVLRFAESHLSRLGHFQETRRSYLAVLNRAEAFFDPSVPDGAPRRAGRAACARIVRGSLPLRIVARAVAARAAQREGTP